MPTLEASRAWYPSADAVHGFDHILRVYRLAERLAAVERADLEIVRAAALLHDAEDPEFGANERLAHHLASAEFAGRVLTGEGWAPDRVAAVQHCIRAHRFRDRREPPATLEAQVLFDADKLDAIGAVGVARAIAYAVQAGQPFYAPPSDRFLARGETEPGEPHSAYHEYLFKLRWIKDRLFTAGGRRLAAERHAAMQAYFERLDAELRGAA